MFHVPWIDYTISLLTLKRSINWSKCQAIGWGQATGWAPSGRHLRDHRWLLRAHGRGPGTRHGRGLQDAAAAGPKAEDLWIYVFTNTLVHHTFWGKMLKGLCPIKKKKKRPCFVVSFGQFWEFHFKSVAGTFPQQVTIKTVWFQWLWFNLLVIWTNYTILE